MTGAEPRARRVFLIDPATGEPSSSSGLGNVYLVPPKTFPSSYLGDQVDEDILTPAIGKKLQIIGVYITSNDASFEFILDLPTSALTVLEVYEAGQLGTTIPMNITGEVNESLRLNIDTVPTGKWFILVNYAEVDP